MVTINGIITALYYGITLFFLVVLVRNFLKTRSPQEALLYCIIMIPFALRLLRIK